MSDDLAGRLAQNLKQLRQARGLTQQQVADLSGLPRATWSNLESGAANPTLTVLYAAAKALQVPIEELMAVPRADVRFYPKGSLPTRVRGNVTVDTLLPDSIVGTMIERLQLARGTRLVGTPHTPGTREYLCCESGAIELAAAGEIFRLGPGDVVVFRGDQRHSYKNPGSALAVGYSIVMLRPVV